MTKTRLLVEGTVPTLFESELDYSGRKGRFPDKRPKTHRLETKYRLETARLYGKYPAPVLDALQTESRHNREYLQSLKSLRAEYHHRSMTKYVHNKEG